MPFGSSLSDAHGNLYLFNWVFGAERQPGDIDFGRDIDEYTAALGPILNAENPDLAAFRKRGGKLIMTAGSADSVVPYHASIEYYDRVVEHCGSLETAQSFFKFYIVPGMSHGSSGPGLNRLPDLIEAVRAWREDGRVPDELPAERVVNEQTEIAMPLFPYPAKTGWDETSKRYIPTTGPCGGIEPIAPRFRPLPEE